MKSIRQQNNLNLSLKRGKSQGKTLQNIELVKLNSNKVQTQLFQKEIFRSKTPYSSK